MPTTLKKFFALLMQKFFYHDLLAKSAEITYYLFFSIFPLLLLTVSLLPLLNVDPDWLITFIENNFDTTLIQPVLMFINDLITNTSTTALGLGIVLTLYSSSTATNSLIKNLNRIYEVNLTRSFVRFRLISIFSTVLLLATFFFSGFIFSVTSDFFIKFLDPKLALYLAGIKHFLVPLFLVILLSYFYLISPMGTNYRFQVLPGVILVVISFDLMNTLVSYYLVNFSSIDVTYGAITSIIIFMLYLYINTLIILLGGLLNSTFLDLKAIKKISEANQDLTVDGLIDDHINGYKENSPLIRV